MRLLVFTTAIVLLDQAVKQLLLRWIDLPLWLISDQVGLQLSMNEGIAFSIPITGLFVIILTLLIIFGVIFYYKYYTKSSLFSSVCFGLIIGGAIGNLWDRLFYSAVIDFIKIYSYPTFNIADIAITVGFLLLIFFFDRIKL